MTVMRVNGKVKHISDIMLVCNQFKEVRRRLSPTDTHWADFIKNETRTSTSIKLGIRGYWGRFHIKVFESEHSFSLGF